MNPQDGINILQPRVSKEFSICSQARTWMFCLFVFFTLNANIYSQDTNVLGQVNPLRQHFPDGLPLVPKLKAETTNQLKLIELAHAFSHGGLSYAEEQMLLAAASNAKAICISQAVLNQVFGESLATLMISNGKTNSSLLDLNNSQNWPSDCSIRADLIKWLCTDQMASSLVTYGGVSISGARILGKLDLAQANIPFRIQAEKCVFTDDIILYACQMKGLTLAGTHIKNLKGNRFNTEQSVNMVNGFVAEGEVNFQNASIGGDLACNGAEFINTNAYSICADGIRVDGSVMLRNGFKSVGEVRFIDSKIDGIVDCSGAQFLNAKGDAMDFSRAKVERVICLKGFKSEGAVNFVGAAIGGDLICTEAQFDNTNAMAFAAQRAKISGSVFLRNPIRINGQADLSLAFIEGNLELNGEFINPNPSGVGAIALENAEIGGNLSIGRNLFIQGGVDVVGVKIKNGLYFENVIPIDVFFASGIDVGEGVCFANGCSGFGAGYFWGGQCARFVYAWRRCLVK